jgi:hypothetical protein
MLTPVAYGLAVALDLLVLLIGGRFLTAPRAAAASTRTTASGIHFTTAVPVLLSAALLFAS